MIKMMSIKEKRYGNFSEQFFGLDEMSLKVLEMCIT